MTSDAAYLSGITRVADFRTIQGFFQFWNQLPLPSNFHERKGPAPCLRGPSADGLRQRGVSQQEAHERGRRRVVYQNQWESDDIETVGRILGADSAGNDWETLDPGCEICGARVVDKSKSRGPTYRLELWFRRNQPVTSERIPSASQA